MTTPTGTALTRATVAVACGHLALALLIVVDRAGLTGTPGGVIPRAADHWVWAPLHVTAALALYAALILTHHRMPAHAISTGILAGWSLLMGVWAIQLEPDGTWAVAALGLVLAAVSFALSGLWADREV